MIVSYSGGRCDGCDRLNQQDKKNKDHTGMDMIVPYSGERCDGCDCLNRSPTTMEAAAVAPRVYGDATLLVTSPRDCHDATSIAMSRLDVDYSITSYDVRMPGILVVWGELATAITGITAELSGEYSTRLVYFHFDRRVSNTSFFDCGDLLWYHNSSLEPRWFGGGQRTSSRG